MFAAGNENRRSLDVTAHAMKAGEADRKGLPCTGGQKGQGAARQGRDERKVFLQKHVQRPRGSQKLGKVRALEESQCARSTVGAEMQ